jgi:hypothetical protein
MNNSVCRWWGKRSRFLSFVLASVALTTTGATLPTVTPEPLQPITLADVSIQVPVVIPGYPVIIIPRRRVEAQPDVLVRFIAQGDDWASIYLDGRLLFRANNTRRDYNLELEPGAYHLEITGTTRFDSWDSGYLDVGRNDSNIIVIRYGRESGIRVSGDSNVWIPD